MFLSVGLSSSCPLSKELSVFHSHSSLSTFHPVFASGRYATASNTDLEFQQHGHLCKYVKSSGELAKRPSTYHLVVCGATDEPDIWLLGDFLGFTSALEESSVHETFVDCFDLTHYLANSKKRAVGFR